MTLSRYRLARRDRWGEAISREPALPIPRSLAKARSR
jgi:hypothetical protein